MPDSGSAGRHGGSAVEDVTTPVDLRPPDRAGIFSILLLPGLASIAVMIAAWALPRGHATDFGVLAALVVLFFVQFVAAIRHESGPRRVALLTFSVVLVYFAVFGVAYAEYAVLAHRPEVFVTDRLGEAFLLSTSMGTATGYVPGRGGSALVGFLTIVHLQILVLAVGVASSTAATLARSARRRARERNLVENGQNGE